MKVKVLASMILCAVLAAPAAFSKGGVKHLLKTIQLFTPRQVEVIGKLNLGQLEAISKLDYEQLEAISDINLKQLEIISKLNLGQLEAIHKLTPKQVKAIHKLDKDALDIVAELVEAKG